MNIYAIIDTNVIVSSFLKPESIPDLILSAFSSDKLIVFINEQIVDEYRNVLFRPKFSISKEKLNYFFNLLGEKAIHIRNEFENAFLFQDKTDAVFYEVTMTSRKTYDTKLVTGNLKHFPRDSFVVSPREMLVILQDNKIL